MRTMVGRSVPALCLAAVALVVTGCGHSSKTTAAAPSTSATPSTTAPSTTAPVASPTASSTTPSHSASPSRSVSSTPVISGPTATISIPPNLCAATDIAQNTADAYMGALSAGNLTEAVACVFPATVPEATTRSLLATAHGTAVYLPQAGVDGPSVFGYAGGGRTVQVTVTRKADGKNWITAVRVAAG